MQLSMTLVLPARQLDEQPLGFAAEKPGTALLRRSQVEPVASSGHSDGIMYFGLDGHNV